MRDGLQARAVSDLADVAAMSAQGDAQAASPGALTETDCTASKDEREAGTVCLDGRSLDIEAVVAVAR